MNIMKYLVMLLLFFIFSACDYKNEKEVIALLQSWQSREIIFQKNPIFTIQGRDTVSYLKDSKYKILTYIDSDGCAECKLRLDDWKKFIIYIDSISDNSVQFLFFFSNLKVKNMKRILSEYQFDNPVCIDVQDSLGLLNNFPTDIRHRTFLLDEDNKVLFVGNPMYNPEIRNLFVNQLLSSRQEINKYSNKTTVKLSSTMVDFGNLGLNESKKKQIRIQNIGDCFLAIDDITTSCGCVTVKYDKEPVLPNKSIILDIMYQSIKPEYFDKTITIYCNAMTSPIFIRIVGHVNIN